MWNFKNVNPKQSFPELEEEILKYWEENNIFEKSIKNREGAEEFNFYDGPPFATGLPHYGHLLAGTIKDVVPRYQTMKGKKVERIFGWDCHGLPIENLVEKLLNISGRDEIEKKVWIDKFNETCRANVLKFTEEWKKIVKRVWRWVDIDHPYIAMDPDFMEAVWWVFKKLYEKGLVYEGYRVVPYCPRCSTSLSNFEVAQGYKDKSDKTVTAKFKIWDKRYILAWTTTPWTLPANLGLAVGEDIDYVEIHDKTTGENYILAKDRLSKYYKNEEDYEIVKQYKGKDLVGIEYEPLLKDILDENAEEIKIWDGAYKVIIWHHVTTDSWTGIVHIAPTYGEDDYQIWVENNLGFISHIDDTGKTKSLKPEWNGKNVFDFNQEMIDFLKQNGKIVKIESITHSYPHCWRCDTPLIYRAIPAWYVKVTDIKDDMIANNQKVHWVPKHIWTWRFGKWLENAKDWNISRNRYWATPIPVWKSEDGDILVIGTVKELYEYNKDFGDIEKKGNEYIYKSTGQKVDLHKHFVDKILLKKDGKVYKRIPELLDVWFDSGSMPYALARIISARKGISADEFFEYMDKLVEETEKTQESFDYRKLKDLLTKISSDLFWKSLKDSVLFKFPADFIAEWQDQTRGWFYTLMVLWTALFKNTPYYNVIVNWIILAEDGKKMSKRLKNYPDPMYIVEKYGADSMRFYLMSSPAVQAQELRFSEKGVEETMRKVILPLWNTYYFFTTYANIDWWMRSDENSDEARWDKLNPLDKWIISELNKLIKDVENAMDEYTLMPATRYIVDFMDNLTNWYIRRSRRRFWKSENDNDKIQAYETLYEVLVKLTQVLAPFAPFVTDYIYKDLTKQESVHLSDWPKYDKNLIDEKLNQEMQLAKNIVSLWLSWRARNKIRVRQPLAWVKITKDLPDYYKNIIKDELNVKDVVVSTDLAKEIAKPEGRKIGPKYGKAVQQIIKNAKEWNFEKLEWGKIKVFTQDWEFVLEPDEYTIEFIPQDESLDLEAGFGIVVALDKNITEDLLLEGYARDIVRFVQEARKKADYHVSDRIQLKVESEKWQVTDVLNKFKDYIEKETLSTIVDKIENPDIEVEENLNDNIKIQISLKK